MVLIGIQLAKNGKKVPQIMWVLGTRGHTIINSFLIERPFEANSAQVLAASLNFTLFVLRILAHFMRYLGRNYLKLPRQLKFRKSPMCMIEGFWKQIIHKRILSIFYRVIQIDGQDFRCYISLMNALVYVNIDQGYPCHGDHHGGLRKIILASHEVNKKNLPIGIHFYWWNIILA